MKAIFEQNDLDLAFVRRFNEKMFNWRFMKNYMNSKYITSSYKGKKLKP